jgi:addiction module RelB/DinJ family antitoxin
MTSATIQIYTDADIKAKADSVFKRLGITLSDGLNMYLRQVATEQAIPFQSKISESASQTGFTTSAEKQKNRAEAFDGIMAIRKRCKPVTTQEILEWRDEGRP